MSLVTDQAGFEINIPDSVNRIVSTVPSQTELLFDLGLGDKITGVTRFCVHPRDRVNDVEKIGGTKDLDIDKIKALKPDLILGNKEENIKEQIERLKVNFPVWLSDVETFDDALDMITATGELTGTEKRARDLTEKIVRCKDELLKVRPQRTLKTLYFIWKDPYMVAGKNTFIREMMRLIGLETAVHKADERYPQISRKEIAELRPEVILLSSEPFPFSSGDLHNIANLSPDSKAFVVDGQYFSWYGSRMLPAMEYLKRLAIRLNGYF